MADNVTADEAGSIPIPEVSEDLIKWLTATHPQRVIQKGEDVTDAHRRAGFQDCIDLLAHTAALQRLAQANPEDESFKGQLVYDVPDPAQYVPEAIQLGGRHRVHRHTRNSDQS